METPVETLSRIWVDYDPNDHGILAETMEGVLKRVEAEQGVPILQPSSWDQLNHYIAAVSGTLINKQDLSDLLLLLLKSNDDDHQVPLDAQDLSLSRSSSQFDINNNNTLNLNININGSQNQGQDQDQHQHQHALRENDEILSPVSPLSFRARTTPIIQSRKKLPLNPQQRSRRLSINNELSSEESRVYSPLKVLIILLIVLKII
jgi:hypothetical protein